MIKSKFRAKDGHCPGDEDWTAGGPASRVRSILRLPGLLIIHDHHGASFESSENSKRLA